MNVGAATIQCLAQSGFSYRGDKLNVDFSWGDYGSFTASLKNGANAQDNEGICGGRYEHGSSDRKEIRSTLMRRLPQTSPVALGSRRNMKSWENRGQLPCDDCRRYDFAQKVTCTCGGDTRAATMP